MNRQKQLREAAPPFSEIKGEKVRIYAEEMLSSGAVILPSEALPQSLSFLVGYAAINIYRLFCSSKGRGVTQLTVETELVSCQENVTKLLFKCVSCMLPWVARRWLTALSVRRVANTWYFHLVVHSGGIIIQWGRPTTFARMHSSVGMCTGAVTMKQLTCRKFTSCSLLFVYSDQNAKSCNLSLEQGRLSNRTAACSEAAA